MTVQAGNQAAARSGGVTLALAIAAIIMFLAAASLIGLGLAGMGGSVSINLGALAALGLGLVLAASGVEALRRRHFWFAVLVPAGMALFNLGYAIYAGVYEALVTVVMFAAAAALVAASRAAFESAQPTALPADGRGDE